MKDFLLLVALLVATCSTSDYENYKNAGSFSLEERVKELEKKLLLLEASRGAVFKTCEELRSFDASTPSGEYRIDPDGQGGEDPILVYCNMENGVTLVPHDKLIPMKEGACHGGCRQTIAYNATVRQMFTLIRESDKCQQRFSFKTFPASAQYPVECSSRLIEFSDGSWWRDRNNGTRSFAEAKIEPGLDGHCQVNYQLWCASNKLPVTELVLNEKASIFQEISISHLECVGRLRGKPGPPGPKGECGQPGPQCGMSKSSGWPCQRGNIGSDTICLSTPTGCYCLVEKLQNWQQSSEFCKSNGMQLVSIETQEEQKLVESLVFSSNASKWWTSGTDKDKEGDWLWSGTGERFKYTKWEPGQPNGGNNHHYLHLERTDNQITWKDYCGYENCYSICEY